MLPITWLVAGGRNHFLTGMHEEKGEGVQVKEAVQSHKLSRTCPGSANMLKFTCRQWFPKSHFCPLGLSEGEIETDNSGLCVNSWQCKCNLQQMLN